MQDAVNVGDPERLRMCKDDDEKLGFGKEGDRQKDKFNTVELNHRSINHLDQGWESKRSMNSHFGKGEV